MSGGCKAEEAMGFVIKNRSSIGGHFMYMTNFHNLLTDFDLGTGGKLGLSEDGWIVSDFLECRKIRKV